MRLLGRLLLTIPLIFALILFGLSGFIAGLIIYFLLGYVFLGD